MIQTVHGGDIYRNQVNLDFSVNINPLGIPFAVKQALQQQMDSLQQYPDPYCSQLVKAISEKQMVPESKIICGNGASEIFQMIVAAVQPKNALLTAPAFSGYEYALSQLGSQIQYYMLKEQNGFALDREFLEKLTPDLDLVFLCNPNNPVGNVLDPELIRKIATACMENNTILVVDECFLEFSKDYAARSMKADLEKFPNMIVVNAFTKIYAMPGIRLGYGMCADKQFLQCMRQKQTEWSVSVFAQIAGIAALTQEGYLDKGLHIIETERAYLEQTMDNMGIKVFPSNSNFILWKDVIGRKEALLKHGILIRSCSNYKGLSNQYYRIAVKKHEENVQLITALQEMRERNK